MKSARLWMITIAATLVACGGAESAVEEPGLPPEPPGDAAAPPPVDDGFANRPPGMGPLPEEALSDSARQGPIFEVPAVTDTTSVDR